MTMPEPTPPALERLSLRVDPHDGGPHPLVQVGNVAGNRVRDGIHGGVVVPSAAGTVVVKAAVFEGGVAVATADAGVVAGELELFESRLLMPTTTAPPSTMLTTITAPHFSFSNIRPYPASTPSTRLPSMIALRGSIRITPGLKECETLVV